MTRREGAKPAPVAEPDSRIAIGEALYGLVTLAVKFAAVMKDDAMEADRQSDDIGDAIVDSLNLTIFRPDLGIVDGSFSIMDWNDEEAPE